MKVLITFNNDYICFNNYIKTDSNIDLNKTNILDVNNMAFSDEFIFKNLDLITSFLKVIIIKKGISKIKLESTDLSYIVFPIINKIENLKFLYIEDKNTIDIDTYNYLIDSNNIKHINCYNMYKFSFERLNIIKNIKIYLRCKMESTSHFLEDNNLISYSDIYYKKQININNKLNDEDLESIKSFLNINKNLKSIHLYYYDINDIIKILNLIGLNDKKNIKFIIYQNNDNVKDILKTFDKVKKNKFIKKNKLYFKINYQKNYISKNILKQINITFLKFILLMTIILMFIFSIIGIINNRLNTKKTDDINNEIQNIVEENTDTKENINTNSDIKTEKPKEKSAYFKNYKQIFSDLKKINKDTVGWLKINNSSIDYPIVKTTNNDKYLSYSFDNSKNPNGWLFMDNRNNPSTLDKNTIIYGHSGNYYVMFGSLYKTLNKSWYTNSINQTITFNTVNSNMKWQIFSIYTIPDTNDYLINNFTSDDSYMLFLNKIKKRSIYNFNIEVNSSDKILTLSTCYKDSKNRLVIHAKLKTS